MCNKQTKYIYIYWVPDEVFYIKRNIVSTVVFNLLVSFFIFPTVFFFPTDLRLAWLVGERSVIYYFFIIFLLFFLGISTCPWCMIIAWSCTGRWSPSWVSNPLKHSCSILFPWAERLTFHIKCTIIRTCMSNRQKVVSGF